MFIAVIMKKVLSFIATGAFLLLFSCQPEEKEAVVKPKLPLGSSAVEEAFPGKTGTIEKGYLFGTPIEYAKIDGQAVFQGDIILTPEQLAGKEPGDNRNGQTEGAGRTSMASRWPNNIVYYTIHPDLPAGSRTRVSEAITHWQTNTRIRFVARTIQTNYVTFRPGSGCSSHVGMIGNQQFITISTACSTGNIIHEIDHALGVWHEQSRADRNSYITIHWGNISPGTEHNFRTYVESGNDGFDHGTFDFGSIMMYGPYSFSKNGLPTITRRDGSIYSVQRIALSTGDKAIIKVMYYVWQQLPGAAKDIGVGANGSVYVIGTGATSGGYGIYRWNGVGWTQLPGGAVRVAVNPQGVPWVVNSLGNIFRFNGVGWQQMPGGARDIGIGANGSVYVIGTGATSGGYGIHQWSGSKWYRLTGGAIGISVGPTGIPWVVNSVGNIYRGQ